MPFADLKGTRIAYVDSGPETAIRGTAVLSHSLFMNKAMMAELADHLRQSGFRTVAYDHPSQGASAPVSRADLSLDRLTETAATFIESLAVAPVHFIGNSLGGMVALRLGTRRRDLVHTITALGSSAEEEHSLPEFRPLVDHLGLPGGVRERLGELMHIMFGDRSLAEAASNPIIGQWKSYMGALPTSISAAAAAVITRDRIIEGFEQNGSVPVLAIGGTDDHAYPPLISVDHIVAATNGTGAVIDGAGHSWPSRPPHAWLR